MLLKRFVATALLVAFTALFNLDASAGIFKERKFKSLFKGKDLSGWEGATDGYRAKDGELTTKDGVKGNLYTEEDFTDFVLRFEFKLTPGANNGLGLRLFPGSHGAYQGIELQILDDTADKYKDLKEYQYHGSVYGVFPAKRGYLNPVGEWNTQEVVHKGNHIKVTLNGTVIVDTDVTEASEKGTADGKEHPGLKRTSGRIGFLGHGAVLFLRNIRIKELKPKKCH